MPSSARLGSDQQGADTTHLPILSTMRLSRCSFSPQLIHRCSLRLLTTAAPSHHCCSFSPLVTTATPSHCLSHIPPNFLTASDHWFCFLPLLLLLTTSLAPLLLLTTPIHHRIKESPSTHPRNNELLWDLELLWLKLSFSPETLDCILEVGRCLRAVSARVLGHL
jgi:hypothetical protein